MGLPEVGLSESISREEVQAQLLCIICTVFALLNDFRVQVMVLIKNTSATLRPDVKDLRQGRSSFFTLI